MVLEVGHPILREPARPLSFAEIPGTETKNLIDSMREAMRAMGGVGLAAPQVGEQLRLFVVEDPGSDPPIPFRVFINPELSVRGSGVIKLFEGCLSVPGFQAMVSRPRTIAVRALDHNGEPFVCEAEEWHARILQHELDHLEGRLFVDQMDSRTITTRENFDRYWREDDQQAAQGSTN